MSCNIELRAYPKVECDPDYRPMIHTVFMEHFRNAQQKANRYREEIIFDRLKQLGHSFSSNEEKEKFARERLVFITRSDHHPDWRELYLFPEQMLIASWRETIEFETFTGDNYATMSKIGFNNDPRSTI